MVYSHFAEGNHLVVVMLSLTFHIPSVVISILCKIIKRCCLKDGFSLSFSRGLNLLEINVHSPNCKSASILSLMTLKVRDSFENGRVNIMKILVNFWFFLYV